MGELVWLSPLTWLLEDRLGSRCEVDVEPASFDLCEVGDELEVGGERFRLVGRRGRMVGTRWTPLDGLDTGGQTVVGS